MLRLLALLALLLPGLATAQPLFTSHTRISAWDGRLEGKLDNSDFFGRSVAHLGDLDGDGRLELAVGAPGDDDGGSATGAVWIVQLREDGRVRRDYKVSMEEGRFEGELRPRDGFGTSVASLGDLDGDGLPELVVGAPGDDDGGEDRGAAWILFLEDKGRVKQHLKLSHAGILGALPLQDGDAFGEAVATIGDLDGDGIAELAVGAPSTEIDGREQGALYVLYLNRQGRVRAWQELSGRVYPSLRWPGNRIDFGVAAAGIGDVDGDGVPDLAVGAHGDNDGGDWRGAVHLLFLNRDGSIKAQRKISDTSDDFTGLADLDKFGTSVASLGDLDGNGLPELFVGAPGDSDGGTERGAGYVLFLGEGGQVARYQKLGNLTPGFMGALSNRDYFGFSAIPLGDLNGDAVDDFAVGARGDGDSGTYRGTVWVFFGAPQPAPPPQRPYVSN